ncbi:hypothetical protein LOAG_07246 [Loa loa]|uniref:diacylglycerol O-acyltransferase n=1 Tax=Loa loa TaxID=7209 RepID=A0A1S0TXP8_LOALO|nr:hypothetical protein LOAG_07246 [Loa loa]EFO21242.1 hypothetical protein LOAG_07246 [Loa loa]
MNDHEHSPRRRLRSWQSNDTNISSSSSHSSLISLAFKRNSYDPEKPVHVAQDSLFSGSSGWKDYRGFLNLAVLLLYGLLVSPTSWIYFISTDPWWKWPNLAMVLMSNISIVTVFTVEKSLVWKWLSNQLAFAFYLCIFSLHISVPAVIIWTLQVYKYEEQEF